MNNMAQIIPDSGFIEVNAGSFQCTMFPGHFYPVFFRTAAGMLPDFRFADNAVTPDFRANGYEERWAESEILENSDTVFRIRRRGAFCHSDTPKFVEELPGAVIAYTWSFQYGSPAIGATVEWSYSGKVSAAWSWFAPVWRTDRASCSGPRDGWSISGGGLSSCDAAGKLETVLTLEHKR